MDLVKMYINQRRFGAFVQRFMEAEYERRKQEAEKENDLKLWIAFVHSYCGKTYDEWKKQTFQPGSTTPTGKSDADLNDDGIQAIFDDLFD